MVELVAKFENSLGREHKLRVKNANKEMPSEQIRASLEKLTTVDLFRNKKDARLFDKVITASFLEEFERTIFDNTIDEVIEVEVGVPAASMDVPTMEAQETQAVVLEQKRPLLEDFKLTVVEEKMIEPNVLKQVLELPLGLKMSNLFQEQKRALIVSKMPEGGKAIEAKIHNEENPVHIELLVQLKEEIEEKDNSSPPQDQRGKQSLLDRLKKRRQLE
ncbi:hypothetical protein [Enterococcus sp.]|uniref:hypothetical protein n=1 Tax=Enterococcus sp. TaxID=35783 RepID=UPI002914FA73|nr:hypothetical protein [Enterococcus sp.]MDU5333183.1 hypothetical protein [Enterococcus sp.]